MASEQIRDPANYQLLTPENFAFIVINYQPAQVNPIASMDSQLRVNNIVGCAKAAVDCTSINSRENEVFHEAVEVFGRRKLIMIALRTDACLTFPLAEGYDVYIQAVAAGGPRRGSTAPH